MSAVGDLSATAGRKVKHKKPYFTLDDEKAIGIAHHLVDVNKLIPFSKESVAADIARQAHKVWVRAPSSPVCYLRAR